MNCDYRTILRFLVIIIFIVLSHASRAQWKKSETLTGGAIVSDMIDFNGDLYIALTSAGIFKSMDDGGTWTQVPVSAQPNPTHFAISEGNLLAISYGKCFRTLDGEQWSENAGPDGFINDVGYDESANVFAATHNGIYQSANGGMTWTRNADVQAQASMKSVAVNGTTVFAGADVPAGGTLLKSADGGTTWTKTTRGTVAIQSIVIKDDVVYLNSEFDGVDMSTDGGVNWQRIRNANGLEGRLYVGASTLYYLSRYKLYTSANAGNTWVEKSQMIPFYNASTLYVTDQFVFVGLWGGGIVRASITGDTDWQLMNNGIAVHDINDLEVVGSTIYVGLENSFIRSSHDEGLTWGQKKDTYGLFAASGRALLATGSALFVGLGGGGVQVSLDNGATWALRNDGLISGNVLAFAAVGNDVFVATDDGVYKSINLGDTWAKKTDQIAMVRTVYTDGANIYAGTYDGLFHSADFGETWTRISAGLPDQSIGAMTHIGSTLYAATQFNGLYKTSNLGQSWEKVTDQFVRTLAARHGLLFMSTLDQQLLVSYDSGRTAEDIAAALPAGGINAIDFTTENIVIGKASTGLWTRTLTQIAPPYVVVYSMRNDDKFFVGTPIVIESDQALYTSDGSVLSDVSGYITISDASGNPVPYTVEIDAERRLISLNITDAMNGESYKISVGGMYNESGLASDPITRTFSATVNQAPQLAEALVGANQGYALSFTPEMFSAAFIDADGDALAKLMVKALPLHGTLTLDQAAVVVNQEIPATSLGQLSYTSESGFSGTDYWFWNGSDGYDYSTSDVKMTIDVVPVTSVYPELSSNVRFYPNPVSTQLNIDFDPADISSVHIINAVGEQVGASVIGEPSHLRIDFSDLPPGIYIIKVKSGAREVIRQRIIKR